MDDGRGKKIICKRGEEKINMNFLFWLKLFMGFSSLVTFFAFAVDPFTPAVHSNSTRGKMLLLITAMKMKYLCIHLHPLQWSSVDRSNLQIANEFLAEHINYISPILPQLPLPWNHLFKVLPIFSWISLSFQKLCLPPIYVCGPRLHNALESVGLNLFKLNAPFGKKPAVAFTCFLTTEKY